MTLASKRSGEPTPTISPQVISGDADIRAEVRDAKTGELYEVTMFVSVPLSRWERIRLRCSWFYIRQTRPFARLTEWWLNR